MQLNNVRDKEIKSSILQTKFCKNINILSALLSNIKTSIFSLKRGLRYYNGVEKKILPTVTKRILNDQVEKVKGRCFKFKERA